MNNFHLSSKALVAHNPRTVFRAQHGWFDEVELEVELEEHRLPPAPVAAFLSFQGTRLVKVDIMS